MARKGKIKSANNSGQIELKPTTNRILIAEDDKDTTLTYREALEGIGYDVRVVYNGEDCAKTYLEEFQKLRLLKSKHPTKILTHSNQPFDAVILDYKMPKMNGMEVAKEILAVNPHQRIIFASAYIQDTLIETVRELKQVVELLQKPFSYHLLLDTVLDNQIYEQLKKYKIDVKVLKNAELSHEQLMRVLDTIQNANKGLKRRKTKG